LFQLLTGNLKFTGFVPFAESLPGCVEFTYSSMTTLPATDNENKCPDGNNGPCSTDQGESPITPFSQALPASTEDTTSGLKIRAGWIHLPYLPSTAAMAENLGAPSMSVETCAAGVLTAIRAILKNPQDIHEAVLSRLQI